MLKKMAILLSILSFQISYAETCPDLAQIKQNIFYGWQALNTDSAEPISSQELEKFKQDVIAFDFAQWREDAPEGSGQCYYKRVEDDSGYADVYFAKATSAPNETIGNWHKTSWNSMKCDMSITACQFHDK